MQAQRCFRIARATGLLGSSRAAEVRKRQSWALKQQVRALHFTRMVEAGHSHWSNIVHHKTKKDLAKSSQFARCARDIATAVRLGGGNTAENGRLAAILQKARAMNFPRDKIEIAIQTGLGKGAAQVEPTYYEVYGPGGSAMMIEAFTDNNNRTSNQLKHILGKRGLGLGQPGSLKHIFRKRGFIEITLKPTDTEDAVMEAVMEAEAEDCTINSEHVAEIYTQESDLWEVRRKLEKKGYTVKSADVIDFANTTIQLNKEKMEEFTTLLREINEIPDISDISNNVEPPEEEEEDEE